MKDAGPRACVFLVPTSLQKGGISVQAEWTTQGGRAEVKCVGHTCFLTFSRQFVELLTVLGDPTTPPAVLLDEAERRIDAYVERGPRQLGWEPRT